MTPEEPTRPQSPTPVWTPPGDPAGGWGPPTRPARSTHGARLAAIVAAVVLVVVSAVAGAAAETALRPNAASSPSASPFGNATAPPGNGGGFGSGLGSGPGTAAAPAAPAGLDVEGIAAKVRPGLVNIAVTLDGAEAAGTGMVLTPSGEVLTNNHVIDGATSVQVQLANGSTKSAKVLGYDVGDDVALLQIQGASNLTTVSVGDSSSVHSGQDVVAVGNALGHFGTPSAVGGQVTALHQQITAGDSQSDTETLTDMIQVRASIQPGDSGGPLVDTSGRVVGMDTAADVGTDRFGDTSGGSVGFAIPIDRAVSIAHQIAAQDSSGGVYIGGDRALLGVVLDTSGGGNGGGNGGGTGFGDSAGSGSGAAVAQVQSGSAADRAGIEAGDTITSVDGTQVGSAGDLQQALRGYHPGDTVRVGWVDSSGNAQSASVRLGSGPPA